MPIVKPMRKEAIQSIAQRKACTNECFPLAKVFGENLFHQGVQQKLLSSKAFKALQDSAQKGAELTPELADQVAEAIKKWALERGVTHYCHWFQPLTDLTAEKHDAFFEPNAEGKAIIQFGGKELIQGEPDASSFPSGGVRTTFEARGYTAWDPSSPPFLIKKTLVIPTVFLSWTGEALDKKTPLLRSMEALNTQALRILRLFGDEKTERVIPTVGGEQEYFLIDKLFYLQRPDLLCCGRTLFGSHPAKGQELEDQYLGSIPDRILQVMEEAEYELMKVGVPIKTRHNEVAPSQYEIALTFEKANLAADHQMLVMEILKSVADRHQLTFLVHEKPFAGINGSGKHSNWSLATDLGQNLLEPGETPQDNAQFLLFCAAVIRAVHRYSALLLMSVANAGNDHRLGVHEAPPGIISVFLGEQLYEIFETLMQGKKSIGGNKARLELGVSMLPKIPRHSSDRNRTSPFAFTGNKFEFRAVGSSENLARPNIILNTMVTESLDEFASQLEESKLPFNTALNQVIAKAAKEFKPILYEGDNYSEAWKKEAAKRKLPNISNTVDAAKHYLSTEAIALLTRYRVYTRRELESRYEIVLAKYIKRIFIEARSASSIAHTMILPAAIRYLRLVGESATYMLGHDLVKQVGKEISAFRKDLKHLDGLLHNYWEDDSMQRALYARDKVLVALEKLRRHGDSLEQLVDDALWPLPKYHEMLFIK